VNHSDDPIDFKALRIDPAKFAAAPIPAKIRKRRELFQQMPMWWAEKLIKRPRASGLTWYVAIYLWHLDFKNHGKPLKLPNGMLEYDGISRQTKWRALRNLERRGLVRVECRDSKSPIIHVARQPDTFQT
jgi:hypothetical protein